jgi:phosphohistidine phosphatase SixA
MVQVVKKGQVQLQNRLVPDGPVHEWVRRIDDLQPDIDRVLQVHLPMTVKTV